jgi:hypothetical protein
MNPEQGLIQAAYEDAIKKLFAALFDGYAQAAGDPELQQAERNFATGVGLARKARERAIALLS